MARANLYAVVVIERVEGKKAAEARAAELGGELLPVARYGERCPKGADHAHASYDGATWCPSCGQYLSVRISKTEGDWRH